MLNSLQFSILDASWINHWTVAFASSFFYFNIRLTLDNCILLTTGHSKRTHFLKSTFTAICEHFLSLVHSSLVSLISTVQQAQSGSISTHSQSNTRGLDPQSEDLKKNPHTSRVLTRCCGWSPSSRTFDNVSKNNLCVSCCCGLFKTLNC